MFKFVYISLKLVLFFAFLKAIGFFDTLGNALSTIWLTMKYLVVLIVAVCIFWILFRALSKSMKPYMKKGEAASLLSSSNEHNVSLSTELEREIWEKEADRQRVHREMQYKDNEAQAELKEQQEKEADLERKQKEELRKEKRHQLLKNRKIISEEPARIKELIQKHSPELKRRRRELIVDLGYGKRHFAAWHKERDLFIEKILRPKSQHAMTKAELYAAIEKYSKTTKTTKAPEVGNPIEFELYCANLLEQAGWSVVTTKASGDQGADVIANNGAISVVVQCKQYSKPVGNSAVQEAHSAKSHYNANFAVVATNQTYTKSAQQLALSTGVLLLHHDELSELSSLLTQPYKI